MSHRDMFLFEQKIHEIVNIIVKMSKKKNLIISLHKFLKRYFKGTSRTCVFSFRIVCNNQKYRVIYRPHNIFLK